MNKNQRDKWGNPEFRTLEDSMKSLKDSLWKRNIERTEKGIAFYIPEIGPDNVLRYVERII